MNIVDYFDSIRIINLKRRADRRDEVLNEFKRMGIPFVKPKVNFFEAIAPVESAGFPSAGARGCYLSHLAVIKEAIERRDQHILVIEDDLNFSKNLSLHCTSALKNLDVIDWDIAYLGHSLEDKKEKIAWVKISPDTELLCAHFLAINGKVLPRLSEFLEAILTREPGDPQGGPMHYDGALSTFRKTHKDINTYCFSKNLGYQRPSKTDLHALSWFDRIPLFSCFLRYMRQCKSLVMRFTR